MLERNLNIPLSDLDPNLPIATSHADVAPNAWRNAKDPFDIEQFNSAMDEQVCRLQRTHHQLFGCTVNLFKPYEVSNGEATADLCQVGGALRVYAWTHPHDVQLLTGKEDFNKWKLNPNVIGIVPFFEGWCDPFPSKAIIDTFTSKDETLFLGGSPTWIYSNALAASQKEQGKGLTELGRRIYTSLAKEGKPLLVDISHLSQRAAREIMELNLRYTGCKFICIASHANVKQVFPGEKYNGILGQVNLEESTIKLLKEIGGGIGLLPWKGALGTEADWPNLSLDDLYMHYEALLNLGFPRDKIFIGSDPLRQGHEFHVCGKNNTEPYDIPRKFAEVLLEKGHSNEDAIGVMYGNYVEFVRLLLSA